MDEKEDFLLSQEDVAALEAKHPESTLTRDIYALAIRISELCDGLAERIVNFSEQQILELVDSMKAQIPILFELRSQQNTTVDEALCASVRDNAFTFCEFK